jgi:hypothetical protein
MRIQPPDNLFVEITAVMVAFKTRDGRTFWIAGESDDLSVTVNTRVDTEYSIFHGSARVAYPPTATIHATLHNYAGQWREGVPDAQEALGAGLPLLPPPAADGGRDG